jgi:hypothetical protein
MGHVADWNRQSLKKGEVKKMADGGEVTESPISTNFSGGSFEDGGAKGKFAAGRVGFNKALDDNRSVEVGVTGMATTVKAGDFKKTEAKLSGADITYRNKDTAYGVEYDEKPNPDGRMNRTVTLRLNKRF